MAASMQNIFGKMNVKSARVLSQLHDVRRQLLLHQRRFKGYQKTKIKLGSHDMTLEQGHMAKFADGSCVAQVGETAVLVTAVSSRTIPPPTASFFPLTVDFALKFSAAGRIPTNHLRRELGASDSEILTCRVIDRSLRSLFPEGYYHDTQVNCNVLAIDGENDPDVIAINAASAALVSSDIPWRGPVGAVRVGLTKDGTMTINPSRQAQRDSRLNIVVTADEKNRIIMLEGEAQNIPSHEFCSAIEYGAYQATMVARRIASLHNPEKRSFSPPIVVEEEMIQQILRELEDSAMEILTNKKHDKISRDKALQNLRFLVTGNKVNTEDKDYSLKLHKAFDIAMKTIFKNQILNTKSRCDGRSLTQVRPISAQVDLFKPLHGSALFQRGQTQVFCTVAFDSLQAALKPDKLSMLTGETKEKNFMLHYEFPSYATNEIRTSYKSNRRELGHGALAEKGLRAILPDDLPFSVRMTAEVLESNGSSSMASICGGSLALMDAGVNISEAAAGIAMGLVSEEGEDGHFKRHVIMDDILGIEDYFGDMDFKLGGTKSGITALQMDLKLAGIHINIVKEAVERGHKQIAFIIDEMTTRASIFQPRKTTPNMPVIETITVKPAERGQFVGPGGLNIKKWEAKTGVKIYNADEGTFQVFAPNPDAMKEFRELMKESLEAQKPPELLYGQILEVKITEIRENGVMVQIHPAMNPTLLKNSQLDLRTVSHASALGLQVGQKINVKYFGRDPETGAIRISRKAITAISTKRLGYMDKLTK